MAKKKDWAGLKTQYLKSDIMDVRIWYANIWKKWNGGCTQSTKGWRDDKTVFLEKVNEKAQKKLQGTLVERKAKLFNEMEEAKLVWLNELIRRLKNKKDVKIMWVQTIWSIITIFNWESELDWDRVDNSSSINSLRKKIKEEQAKRNIIWGKVKNV